MGFYRSTSADCDLAHYASCPNGQYDLIGGGPVIDTAVNLTRQGFYWLQLGGTAIGPAAVSATTFPARAYPVASGLNGKLYIVGGYNNKRLKDVWSSADGKTWTNIVTAAPFSARQSFAMTAFNGQLWLVGGYDGTQLLNDIWVSSDGIDWTQKPLLPGFSARSNATLISFNDRLWLIGGTDSGGPRNDVWSTTDGVT